MAELSMRGWPASLVEIAEVIGPESALHLVHAFAGLEIYVPHTLAPDHPIVLALGPDAAEKLRERYAGNRIDVPRLDALLHRKQMIIDTPGKPADVARLAGVTARYVRMVRQGCKPDDRQLDLFKPPSTAP